MITYPCLDYSVDIRDPSYRANHAHVVIHTGSLETPVCVTLVQESIAVQAYRQIKLINLYPDSKVHEAHLGPTGPRWASCWPHQLCYLGILKQFNMVSRFIHKNYTVIINLNIPWRDRISSSVNSSNKYTLGKKGCYTPIEDNKTNVDRTFVFPLGWNWHDMDPWLFPNEIRHYLGQTFNARSSGIVELRNHSIGGRSPKSIFTLWQLWINICIFFKSFSDCSNNAPSNPMGIRHEVFALAREGINQGAIAARVGLTRATVNRILKRHVATGSLVPGKSSGAFRKTTPRQDRALLRMVRQDRFLSARALTARMRNLYGTRAGRTTVNNRLLSRGYRAYRPTTKPLLTANHRRLRLEWTQRWRNLTVAHWQHVIFGDESRFQLYPVDGRLRVRRLPGERFRPGCQAHRVQAGGGSVHVWGAFHNSAKSPLVLPEGYLTGVLYRGILQNTFVPFARHYFGDNYRYQYDNATPHRAGVVLDFLQQGNVTKMEQPPRSPDCNPIKHLWDELGRAISSMDNPPQILDELRQALLDKWAQIPVQRLQRLVASMPRRLAAIIAARGGNTRYWPGTHKTRPPGSVTKKIIFVRPNLPQLSSSDI